MWKSIILKWKLKTQTDLKKKSWITLHLLGLNNGTNGWDAYLTNQSGPACQVLLAYPSYKVWLLCTAPYTKLLQSTAWALFLPAVLFYIIQPFWLPDPFVYFLSFWPLGPLAWAPGSLSSGSTPHMTVPTQNHAHSRLSQVTWTLAMLSLLSTVSFYST